MAGDARGSNSSGEYSGVAEQAGVGKSGKAQDLATVLSSGDNIKRDRAQRKAKKEEEEARKREERERNKNKGSN